MNDLNAQMAAAHTQPVLTPEELKKLEEAAKAKGEVFVQNEGEPKAEEAVH